MNLPRLQCVQAAFFKKASEDFWNTGFHGHSHGDNEDHKLLGDKVLKKTDKPKSEEVFGGSNTRETTDGKPDGEGAMSKAVWVGNPAVVSGTGAGSQFTTGMSGGELYA